MPLLISYHLALDFPGLRQYKRYKGKLRVSRQAQTCIIMSSLSSGGEVTASFLLLQICIHSPRYSGCTLYGKCAQEQNSWPTFFAQTGKTTVRFCLRHIAFGCNFLVTTMTTWIGNLLFYHLIFLWLADREKRLPSASSPHTGRGKFCSARGDCTKLKPFVSRWASCC